MKISINWLKDYLALDLPIDGVILPNVASFDHAVTALAPTKFPPAGERSLGNEARSGSCLSIPPVMHGTRSTLR